MREKIIPNLLFKYKKSRIINITSYRTLEIANVERFRKLNLVNILDK